MNTFINLPSITHTTLQGQTVLVDSLGEVTVSLRPLEAVVLDPWRHKPNGTAGTAGTAGTWNGRWMALVNSSS